MTKKSTKKVTKETTAVVESKSGNLSEPKSVGLSIKKYLQLYGSEIHKYTRAYFEQQFRGILKSKEAWDEEINKIMEGKR